ncbi:FecCD family ABC transporter permease [Vibrio sp. NH-7]
MPNAIKVTLSLFVVWLLFAIWHVGAGAVQISATEVVNTLLGDSSDNEFIVMGYRLPRMLVATLVGASLALSGLLVQGIVRNPLASPDILGVTTGASLAVVAVNAMFPDVSATLFPFIAMVGGGIATLVLFSLARHVLNHAAALALIGVALAALFSAGVDFLLLAFPLEINVSMIWLTGSVWGRNWTHIPYLIGFLSALLPIAVVLAYKLDLFALGDETAQGLGANIDKVRLLTLCVAITLACVAVSVCGNIGFIGLIAPHAARFLLGNRHIALIPVCMLIGGSLLLSADLFARILMPPTELPAGVMTAMIGGPYFIFLLSRYKHW